MMLSKNTDKSIRKIQHQYLIRPYSKIWIEGYFYSMIKKLTKANSTYIHKVKYLLKLISVFLRLFNIVLKILDKIDKIRSKNICKEKMMLLFSSDILSTWKVLENPLKKYMYDNSERWLNFKNANFNSFHILQNI